MTTQEAYLIIDIGTGNVRVAVVDTAGKILNIQRDNVQYERDDKYPDALYFEPDVLWEQIIRLTGKALQQLPAVKVKAITAGSQREGIVLLDKDGKSLIGLPNHDHRGREWESAIADKQRVYTLTGRYPSSLFSALKLAGIRERRPEIWEQSGIFLSISDWALYWLTGITGYEHSQASETLLYDVEKKSWSDELCGLFKIGKDKLPPLRSSGSVLGNLLPGYAEKFRFDKDTPVIVGGADTQLAIKSTKPGVGDVVIVSGTTTPVIRITHEYLLDDAQRTWTNRHVTEDQFVIETNCGVTGLNYQRLKEVFYPNEGYEVIEKELDAITDPSCMASLGSLLAPEKSPLTKGGFIFNAPVSHELKRADFAWATLWDMACCIKENYDCLCAVTKDDRDYVWACGGGLQSRHLRQFVAGLINKKIRIRRGYQQSSVMGGALICMEASGKGSETVTDTEVVEPQDRERYTELYEKWKETRAGFRRMEETEG